MGDDNRDEEAPLFGHALLGSNQYLQRSVGGILHEIAELFAAAMYLDAMTPMHNRYMAIKENRKYAEIPKQEAINCLKTYQDYTAWQVQQRCYYILGLLHAILDDYPILYHMTLKEAQKWSLWHRELLTSSRCLPLVEKLIEQLVGNQQV